MTLTSLVGARSCSVRPTNGSRPLQFAQQDEQEERDEDRDVGAGTRSAQRRREVGEALVGVLERVLAAGGDERDATRQDDREHEDDRHDDPAGQDRRRDRDVEDQQARRGVVRVAGGSPHDVRGGQLEVRLDRVGRVVEPRRVAVVRIRVERRYEDERHGKGDDRGHDHEEQRPHDRRSGLGHLARGDDRVVGEVGSQRLLHPALGV